jgi:succinate dehydrogenase / fumarate reductase, iron-sulfur subunit
VTLVRHYGLLHEAELLPRSYGGDSWFGKFAPSAGAELLDSLPVITRALARRKVTPMAALKPHKITDHKNLERYFDKIENAESRYELNLYVVGEEDEPTEGKERTDSGADSSASGGAVQGSPSSSPPERSPNT